jgi:xanthine dehydrogenase accessory factor
MRLDLLAALNEERKARRAAILVTDLTDGSQRLVRAGEIESDPLADALDERLRMGKSGTVESAGKRYFLAPMAQLAGFDVTIVDPRTAFATPERFPAVRVIAEWPDKVLPDLWLDRYTAIALLTHDPKIDDAALNLALKAECFYIGALGSKKTHAKRLERLAAAGLGAQAARIHAPIGLDIGAVSPAEIAVSILGEIVLSLRKKPLRSEKDRAA